MAGAFPGNLNQTEIEILQNAAAGLGKSPEANQVLSDILTAISNRQTNMSQKLNTFLQENRDLDAIDLKLKYDQMKLQIEAEDADIETNVQLAALLKRSKEIDNAQFNAETALTQEFKTPQDIVDNFERFKELQGKAKIIGPDNEIITIQGDSITSDQANQIFNMFKSVNILGM